MTQIHMEECSVEKGRHSWVLLDIEGDIIASIPFELSADKEDATLVLEQVAKGYNRGFADGQVSGRIDTQKAIRDALGV